MHGGKQEAIGMLCFNKKYAKSLVDLIAGHTEIYYHRCQSKEHNIDVPILYESFRIDSLGIKK